MRRLVLVLATVLLIASSTASADPSDLMRFPVEVQTHECFLRTQSCPSKFFGQTTAYTCRTDEGRYYDVYRFTGGYRTYVTVEVVAAFAPVVIITDINGNLLTADNAPTQITSRIVDYQLPYDGTFNIVVLGARPGSVGSYSVDLKCSLTPTGPPPPPAGSCRDAGTLTFGTPVHGVLNASDGTSCLNDDDYYSERYSFFAVADAPVRVTLDAQFGPYLLVTDEKNEIGAYTQQEVPVGLAEIVFTPKVTGRHYIYVSSYAERSGGGYTLEADQEIVPCGRRRSVRH